MQSKHISFLKLTQPLETKILRGIICILAIIPFNTTSASKDSLNLAQCYANLSLTNTYFDTLPNKRLAKIIPYTARELGKITDTNFIKSNAALYNMAFAHMHFIKAKFMFKNKTHVTRAFLFQRKAELDSALFYFNKKTYSDEGNEYHTFAGFNVETSTSLSSSLGELKDTLTLYFNKDIYPNFQRIFYAAKNEGRYYFDSLKYYAGLYNLPLDLFIKENRNRSNEHKEYNLSLPLDLISQFLQFTFILKNKSVIYSPILVESAFFNFLGALNPESDTAFGLYSDIPKDEFFRKELNEEVCDELYKKLKEQFNLGRYPRDTDADGVPDGVDRHNKYYFPIPARFPSSKYAINHFAPKLKTMGQVDKYIRTRFYPAG